MLLHHDHPQHDIMISLIHHYLLTGKVTADQVKQSLIDHCKKNYQFDVQVINCRLSSHILSDNEYDILIYVKDAHWPKVIGNKDFSFRSTPAIPPQLCLLIKNVDLRIDFDEFCNDIHTNYPHIKNIIRMKNKFQNDIKMVKVELTSSSVRDELLDQKRIIVNYITYDIIEYLAPANVLYVPSAWHWVILNSNALKLKKHVVHVEIKLMI
ncbi:unnamed protein product [Rotaria socialis]|uniref:Uncharacterized protein n=1 Tax=Rotaria socialis TaxID=392032 RepID=A0A818AAG5_9BILA|nr:unnamed protein product [Rotaria socialis]